MKLPIVPPTRFARTIGFARPNRCHRAGVRAFTLVEMLYSTFILGFLVAALVSLQIFGIKMGFLATNKMIAVSGALKGMDQIRNSVREAVDTVQIGNYSSGRFSSTTSSSNPIGNALEIPQADGSYLTFYVDTASNILYQKTANGNLTALASSVTNQQVFEADDCYGHLSTNNSEHYTIRMTLKFRQLEYAAGVTNYNNYQLQTQITPRIQ
jgi:type II secretory pathway pseudopilin PulG